MRAGWRPGGKGAVRTAREKLLGRKGSPRGAPQRPPGSTHRSPSSSWVGCGRPIAGLALGPWVLWGKRGWGKAITAGALRGVGQGSWADADKPASRVGVAGEATRKVCAPRRHPIPSLPPQGKAQVRTGAIGSRNASQDSCSPSSHPNPRPSALQGERGKASVAVKGLCCPRPPLPCRSLFPAQAVSSLSPA